MVKLIIKIYKNILLKMKQISLEKPFILLNNKKKEFEIKINELTRFHFNNCRKYRDILSKFEYKKNKEYTLENLPFISVRNFKNYEMLSVNRNKIFKILKSSGTSGSKLSQIFLDKKTSELQQRSLMNISKNFIGNDRKPMLVIDCQNILKNKKKFSARAAAILGFSMYAKDMVFLLNENNEIDYEVLEKFMNKYKDQTKMIFGFTFMIWQHFFEKLKSSKKYDFSNSLILHGGGWKKLYDKKISNDKFKIQIKKYFGIKKVMNYYGMAEQTGSIFFECDQGFFHNSNFSEILIRDKNFKLCKFKEKGIVQTISILPKSYPGHNFITEDIGAIYGENDCKCGRLGKYFKIMGRIENAELRGCSDV
jgi:phenylacetate-coenzyme A ligase PaaK-like adenylate-forming protein